MVILMAKPKSKSKIPLKERLKNAILGDAMWEQIQSIGWTVAILLWIFTFQTLGLWSFSILIGFGIFYRELGIERKIQANKYNIYSFINKSGLQ